jgi:alpha-L-fucosidase
LVEKYKIEIVWSDGDWEADSQYWKSKEFLAWLATNSSVKETVVWNDRWGEGTRCKHGSFWNCADRYIPNTTMEHYFESCITLDKHSWGANRRSSAPDYLTSKELLYVLVQTISRNGNFLLNVGPSADGTINPIMVERLLQMGDWLLVNGDAVFNTRSWTSCAEDDDTIFYTRSIGQVDGDVLYVFLTDWKKTVHLTCPEPTPSTRVRMLGVQGVMDFATPSDFSAEMISEKWTISITLPLLTPDIVPCEHVWVLAIEGVGNLGETAVPRLRR